MQTQKDFFETKTMLAKLLSTEDIQVIHTQDVETAKFDTAYRVLYLPMWKDMSNEVYNLLSSHEVGHALQTKNSEWYAALEYHKNFSKRITFHDWRSILNILEDVRIEKYIKSRYAGIRNDYSVGYEELVTKHSFFGVTKNNFNVMPYIDRVNIYFKYGVRSGIVFTEYEKSLNSKIYNTNSLREVVEVAKQVMEYSLVDISHISTHTREELIAYRGCDISEYSYQFLKDVITRDDCFSLNNSEEDVFGGSMLSYTNDASKKATMDLTESSLASASVVNIPTMVGYHTATHWKKLYDLLRPFSDHNEYRMRKYRIFENENVQQINSMIREFVLHKNANRLRKVRQSNTGELNADILHKYKTSENIFLKTSVVPDDQSHGMIMLVDWSSSMRDKIAATVEQTLILTAFCRRMKIPFSVYCFTTGDSLVGADVEQYQAKKIGDIDISNYVSKPRVLQLLSSEMTNSEYRDCASILLTESRKSHISKGLSMGDTPLKESMIMLAKEALEFRKKYRIQKLSTIILTDGDGGDNLKYVDRIYDDSGGVGVTYSRQTTHLHHPMVPLPVVSRRGGNTLAMIELYKKIVKSTVVGYFVCAKQSIRAASWSKTQLLRSDIAADFTDTFSLEFKNKGFYSIRPRIGYDVFYLIPSTRVDLDKEKFSYYLKDDKTKYTKRELVSAFKKSQKVKMTSRVFVSEFIKQIS